MPSSNVSKSIVHIYNLHRKWGILILFNIVYVLFGKKIIRKEKFKLLLVKESEEQEISPLLDI